MNPGACDEVRPPAWTTIGTSASACDRADGGTTTSSSEVVAGRDQRRLAVEADDRRFGREARAAHAHQVAGHAARRLDGAHERQSPEVELTGGALRPPADATRTGWRLPGAPATCGISKRTAWGSVFTTLAAWPPTVTRQPLGEAAPAQDHLVPGQGARRVESGGAQRSERRERDRPRAAARGLDREGHRARRRELGDPHVQAVARRRAGGDRQRAEPDLVVGRVAVEAGRR